MKNRPILINCSTCTMFTDCGSLTLPTNGFMDATEGTVYDSNIKFYCNNGFLLVGSAHVNCKSDGKWSADPPKCLAKCKLLSS